jgi:hypothetical protein
MAPRLYLQSTMTRSFSRPSFVRWMRARSLTKSHTRHGFAAVLGVIAFSPSRNCFRCSVLACWLSLVRVGQALGMKSHLVLAGRTTVSPVGIPRRIKSGLALATGLNFWYMVVSYQNVGGD